MNNNFQRDLDEIVFGKPHLTPQLDLGVRSIAWQYGCAYWKHKQCNNDQDNWLKRQNKTISLTQLKIEIVYRTSKSLEAFFILCKT